MRAGKQGSVFGLAAAVTFVVLASPATALAEKVGDSLKGPGRVAATGPRTFTVATVERPNPYRVPADGALVGWSLYTTDRQGSGALVRLKVMRLAAPEGARVVQESPPVPVAAGMNTYSLDPPIRVEAGQFLALSLVNDIRVFAGYRVGEDDQVAIAEGDPTIGGLAVPTRLVRYMRLAIQAELRRPPRAIIAVSPRHVRLDSAATFMAVARDPGGLITGYKWKYDDGQSDTARMVRHKFEKPGRHTVDLTVTNDAGLTRAVTKRFLVLGGSTPNCSVRVTERATVAALVRGIPVRPRCRTAVTMSLDIFMRPKRGHRLRRVGEMTAAVGSKRAMRRLRLRRRMVRQLRRRTPFDLVIRAIAGDDNGAGRIFRRTVRVVSGRGSQSPSMHIYGHLS